MNERIIEFLKKKDGYVSGDAIAQRLGITRQGLWKHIQELKELGYDIVAVPHLGYKIESIPDRLFPFEVTRDLDTKFTGKKIHYYEAVPSTMDLAMELGMKGSPEGTVVLAETQTKGKGRLGRIWFSPKYKGIYLSLILRPKFSPQRTPLLTLLSAVSICEAIKEHCGIDSQIKWPNDILIHNKKVAGILTELNAEMDEVNFVIIGIGLNVNNEKKSLISGSTSLREAREEEISRVALLQEILRRIEANYIHFEQKGPKVIIDKWREYSVTLGKRVKVYSHREHIEGQAVNIDIDGGLMVRKDSGLTVKVMAGDVVHCR
ncbi:MAG: biotin--[acetyl-CoA-carboxylase] ligase [Candidatus Omnitrophica bacterium]|nr:biotin--[acetyl-CoA-carboxylase] ligase [Candidatus Omnitrophota bacterium]